MTRNTDYRSLRTTLSHHGIQVFLFAAIVATPFSQNIAGESRRTAIVRAIESQRDAVVNIHGQKMVAENDKHDSSELRRVNGMGTGVVIDSRGYIVTNYHVVEGVRRIEVTLASGKQP